MKNKLTMSRSIFLERIFLTIMKTFVFFLCTAAFSFTSEISFSQEKVTIDRSQKFTVDEVFRMIKKQTDYRFIYPKDLFKDTPKVRLNKGEILLTELLDKSLSKGNLDFELSKNNTILIKENLEVKEEFQVYIVKGTVTDVNGQPLPGANIIEKGTINGTYSNFDGTFTLNVSRKNTTLEITYVGFVSQELVVGDDNKLDIKLVEDASRLEEIVVIGFGTQKKEDVTGAVVKANIESFAESPNTNVAQSLQGTVPGLNIGQVNSAGGTPSISIRGRTTINGTQNVLIILDGIQYTGSLSAINPDDIESIDVLKDASATAVYGAQASNGVILITSKGGKRNVKPKITFSTSFTTQTPSEDIRPMNREEYINQIRLLHYDEAFLAPDYTELDPSFDITTRVISQIVDNGELVDTNFDWWDQGTNDGSIKESKVSVAGGSEDISYLISLGLTEQEGYIINDKFSRKSLRVNLDANINDWWKVGVQSFGSFTNQDGNEPSLYSLFIAPPLLEPYDENGDLISNPTGTLDQNPFLTYDVQDYERHNFIFANLYSEIDIPFIPGLKYRINFGNNYRIDKNYGSSIYGAGDTGSAGKNISFYRDYTLDNILTYKRKFDKHDITATLLYGAVERNGESTDASGRGYERLSLGYNNLGLAEIQEISSSAYQERLNYQMFRLNYKLNNKYLITGTIRRDGFSGFAENNKYGYFPTGALGWVISNEPFLNANWLNYLKLRVGYGISGNQTSRFSSLARLKTVDSYVFGDGGTTAFGQELTSLSNADLKWEKTTGLNIGLEFNMIKNRLRGTLDVYRNITNDLLFDVAIPYLTGFNQIRSNVGKLENRGVEVSLTGDIIKQEDFEWTSTLNFSMNRNEILELTGEDNDEDGIEDDLISSGLFIGQPISAIYNYEANGIYQLGEADIPAGYYPGTYRVVDQDGDDNITPDADRAIIGTSDPAFRASLLNTFKYKQLTLSVYLNSIQGGKDKYLGGYSRPLYTSSNSILRNNVSGIDYWTPSNPDGVHALSTVAPTITPTLYKDRSFVRLQDVSLRYAFSKELIEKLALSDLSIFVSGKNLATWTDWEGWDPETGQGLTAGGRPVLRGYSIGVNLSF